MTQQPIKTKEPVVAFILSLLIAGVGQLYLGQTTKGLVLAGKVLILDIGGVLLSLLLTGLTQAGGGCLTLICCGLPLGISFSLSVLWPLMPIFWLSELTRELSWENGPQYSRKSPGGKIFLIRSGRKNNRPFSLLVVSRRAKDDCFEGAPFSSPSVPQRGTLALAPIRFLCHQPLHSHADPVILLPPVTPAEAGIQVGQIPPLPRKSPS